MAERSFKAEVEHLRKGEGETFTGEGILAITKALLENGVGCAQVPRLFIDPLLCR